jgi:hypothetical protein
MSSEERAILTRLRIHQEEIIQAEMKWNIDRHALVGAIAWEALHNVIGPQEFSIARRDQASLAIGMW